MRARDIGIEVFDWAEFPAATGGPWEFTYAAWRWVMARPSVNGTAMIITVNTCGCHSASFLMILAGHGDMMPCCMVSSSRGIFVFNPDIDGNGVDDLSITGGDYNPGRPGGCKYRDPDRARESWYACSKERFSAGILSSVTGVWEWNILTSPLTDLGQMRFEAEFSRVDGLIFDGAQFPSAQVNDNFGGFQSIRYDTDGRNQGWYVDLGYDIHRHLGLENRATLNVRYDEYDRNKGNKGA